MATYSRILACRIPMDTGAWWAMVHGVAKSWRLLNFSAQHPTAGPCFWDRILDETESLLLRLNASLLSSVVRHCLSNSRVFFRERSSTCSCQFIVSMGGGKFRVFLCHHLKPFFSKQYILYKIKTTQILKAFTYNMNIGEPQLSRALLSNRNIIWYIFTYT